MREVLFLTVFYLCFFLSIGIYFNVDSRRRARRKREMNKLRKRSKQHRI